MSLSKIRTILKRAGYTPEKRITTRVKGYHDVTPGYILRARKEQNPNWYGCRRINPPRWIQTGIFEVSHTDFDNLPKMLEVLKVAGLPAKMESEFTIVIDTN